MARSGARSQAGELAAAVRATDGGALVDVKVVPGASRSRIAGMLGDRIKAMVSAPPEGGRANEAVCALLAEALNVPARAVSLVHGHAQARKTLCIAGLSPAEVVGRLDGRAG